MRNPFRGARRYVALAGALCAGIGLVTAPTAGAAPVATPPVPVLDWQPCDTGFLCATAAVPLDYAHPTGATIDIAMIKHPATDPAHRIGSLFFNPGGPGDDGVTELPPLYQQFPPAVRARFDLVSFDSRGMGQSTDVRCFDTIDQESRLLSQAPDGFPIGAAQERAWETTWGAFDKACAAHADPLLEHDTTADVARDLDLMRQAVGEPKLNYIGISYGTYLGATYANLFPTRVRAMTLDGNADPVAWATGTNGSADRLNTFLRLGSDQGSARALDAFLDLCGRAATTACTFSAGSPAATHAKYAALLDRLAAAPVTIGGQTITKQRAVNITVGGLYHALPTPEPHKSDGWADLATGLETLWTVSNGGPAPTATTNAAMPGLVVPPNAAGSSSGAPYEGREKVLGVVCSDSPQPRSPAEYSAQAAFAAARSGVVGPSWAWQVEACAQWPARSADRYTGPWNHPTAPILVVGNTVDPSTPYAGAVAMSHDLANARLLTVDGYGHTVLANHSTCADTVEDAYFLTGALPAPGAVCRQDQAPFAG